jgi:hypothetical protein
MHRPRHLALLSSGVAISLGLLMAQPVPAAGEDFAARRHRAGSVSAVAPAGPDIWLPTAVSYADCTGATALEHTSVYRDVCLPGIYLLGHNPGPFAVLLALRVGATVGYQGRLFTITSASLTTPAAQWAEAQRHPAELTLQTCANDPLARVWVFTARSGGGRSDSSGSQSRPASTP